MHIKSRKIILFIAAFVIICLALSNHSASSQTISIDKEIYYAGDIVRINYSSIPGDKNEKGFYTGISYWISANSAEGTIKLGSAFDSHVVYAPHYSRAFPGKNTTSGVLEIDTKGMEGAWIARDFTVTLGRSGGRDKGPVTKALITKHFRLRQPKYKPIPGALSLRGGNRFKLGDSIIADINLPPSVKVSHLMEGLSNQVTIFDFHLELHRLNRKTHGGAIEPDQRVHTRIFLEEHPANSTIESHSVEKVIVDQVRGALAPGIYELRLIQKNGDVDYSANYSMHYVVDSVRFEILYEYWPKSLKVLSLDDFKVGEEIKVQLDSAAVSFKYAYSSEPLNYRLGVRLCKVVNDLETMDYGLYDVIKGVYLQYVGTSNGDIVSPNQDIVFRPVKQAGKYVILLGFRRYIIGHLEIDVKRAKEVAPTYSEAEKRQFDQIKKIDPTFEPPPPFVEPHLGTGNNTRFVLGEKIPIEVYMPSDWNQGGKTIVALKRHDPDAGYENGEPMGKQVKMWDLEVGKKQAWTIPGDLAIGTYDLVLKKIFLTDWQGKKNPSVSVAKVTGFQVIPELNTVKIDIKNKKDFSYGEKITFDVLFPPSVNSKDFGLQYIILRIGGYVPGCARESGYRIAGANIEKGTNNITFIAPQPGKYVLQVYGYLLDQLTQGQMLLAQEKFTSDLPWQAEALSFSSQKSEFLHEEEIQLTVDARADLGMGDLSSQDYKKLDEIGKYRLYLYRQGDTGYGGAYRFPMYAYFEQSVEPKDNIILSKERIILPGAYELRLYNMRQNRSGAFLVSRLPFYVTEPGSPFPVEKGNPGVTPPRDLQSPGPYYGLRVGDFLGPDNCQSSLVKQDDEKMELEFVRLDNGSYVEVRQPIEFGAGFYVQGKLEEEAAQRSYIITITTPEGDQQEVGLFPLEDDPTIVRSERVYLIWHPEEEVSE